MIVSRDGAEAVVRARDSGVGMPAEMLPRIFELFTQVDGSPSRSHGGLGIGLLLVRTLVEMHDGRVQARSDGLGEGSEFTVRLPALPAGAGRTTTTVLWPEKPTERSLRVLVVEDNVDAADSLGLLLRLHGHEVLVARSGEMALEAASAFRPAVVLLDIGLPGMDGYHVAQQLRERPEFKGVTLCALTGYTPSEADRVRAPQAGFDHYLVKPVSLETLLELFNAIGP